MNAGAERVAPTSSEPGTAKGRGPVGVAVVGAGNISAAYLKNLTVYPDLDVRWVAARNPAHARERAAAFGVSRAGTLQEVLADPDVEIVVNLTPPQAHVEVATAAIDAGKNVWSEKPLATNTAAGRQLVHHAARSGLRIAVAPDTGLGATLQTLRAATIGGQIGTPVMAKIGFESAGPEAWHPDPAFLYDDGAGPLYDVGPYFVTALVQLLGSVSRVSAVATRGRTTRSVASGPRQGTQFPVRTPTTVAAILDFGAQVVAQAVFSFDAVGAGSGLLEITGTTGRLTVSGDNPFDAPVVLTRHDGGTTPVPASTTPFQRGLGVLDLARSIRSGIPERTPSTLGLHVLEVMDAITQASDGRRWVEISSRAPTIEPLGTTWDPRAATLNAITESE